MDPRPRLRTLRGIVDAPSLRRDGTVIDRPGWDSETWLYADFDPKHWQGLPAKPTRDDARKALLRLYDLVEESLFAEPIHRAAWAALVLTLVGRPYAAGNVPLVAFTRKRLMAIALAGTRCVCIDNIKAGDPLGTPALDAALTAGTDDNYGTVADRVLGETAITEAPWSCVLAATGNNLTVVGDMARRTLLCRLETNNPDPETHVYRHHPKVADYCIAHRGELLTAALTVLVAHHDAVRRGEAKPLPRIGSFGGWSDRIRSAVAWADPDGCDPWASNAEVKAGAQPEQAEALTFLDAWHGTFGTREVVVKEIGEACREGEPDYAAELAEAAGNLSLPPPRGRAGVNTQALGRWLAARKDRPGPFVLREGRRYSGKPARWYVEKSEAAPQDAGAEPGDDQQIYVDMLRDWCQREADPAVPAHPIPGTGDPIPDGMETTKLRCRLDHTPAPGEMVTLCNAELWPMACLRVAEVLEPPSTGAEWAAFAVEPLSDDDLLRDGGAPESGAGTWWRAKVHRVHIVQAVKRKGKVWIVDQDVVMLYRRGADDADRETPDLFEGNGKAP